MTRWRGSLSLSLSLLPGFQVKKQTGIGIMSRYLLFISRYLLFISCGLTTTLRAAQDFVSPYYSCLNASIGCTPAARRAGIQLAAKATASKINTPPIIVAGSHG
jgi:hypothetical protein